MSFRAGPTNDEFSYTTGAAPAAAVQAGALRVHGGHTITRQRIQFKTGEGPAGGNFTGRWLRNGTTMGTITVLNGAIEGSIAAPTNTQLVDGDILTTEVIALGGATGAAVLILDTTTP